MTGFDQHKRTWFLNRVGEIVEREFTIKTPSRIKDAASPSPNVLITTEAHAIALYNYHRDYKVNFKDADKKTNDKPEPTASTQNQKLRGDIYA